MKTNHNSFRVIKGRYDIVDPSKEDYKIVFSLRDDAPKDLETVYFVSIKYGNDLDETSPYALAYSIWYILKHNYWYASGLSKVDKLKDWLEPFELDDMIAMQFSEIDAIERQIDALKAKQELKHRYLSGLLAEKAEKEMQNDEKDGQMGNNESEGQSLPGDKV